jgi:hypothetical protein
MNEIQKSYLLETAKWQKFLGVVMMVCVVLMAIGGIAIIATGSFFADQVEDNPILAQFGMSGFGIMYLLMAVLYYFYARYLLRAAKGLKAWGVSEDEADLTFGLKNNKSYFKFSGILTIIALAIVAIALVAGVIAAIAAL